MAHLARRSGQTEFVHEFALVLDDFDIEGEIVGLDCLEEVDTPATMADDDNRSPGEEDPRDRAFEALLG